MTARLYGVPPARKADLAREVAARMREPATLRRVLRDHLGPEERAILARMLVTPDVALSDMDRATAGSFDVHWEWSMMPAGSGGKLRAYGLAFVGHRAGERSLSYPAELGDLLEGALGDVDPDVVDEVDEIVAASLDGGDDELDAWEEADSEATEAIARATRTPPAAAIREYFEDRPPVTTGAEASDAAEFFALDWQGGALLREHLKKCRTMCARARTLLAAALESCLSIYRVVSVTPGEGATLEDAFRGGTVRVVHRNLARLARPGDLVRMRAIPAGPFHLAWTTAGPVPEAALAWLEDDFAYYAEAHPGDRDEFLRDRAILLYRLPSLFGPEDDTRGEPTATP